MKCTYEECESSGTQRQLTFNTHRRTPLWDGGILLFPNFKFIQKLRIGLWSALVIERKMNPKKAVMHATRNTTNCKDPEPSCIFTPTTNRTTVRIQQIANVPEAVQHFLTRRNLVVKRISNRLIIPQQDFRLDNLFQKAQRSREKVQNAFLTRASFSSHGSNPIGFGRDQDFPERPPRYIQIHPICNCKTSRF